ncbi:MAG: type II toxin-antitoxin system HipA family toxin [Gemmatimonadaceae bacterium]
MSPSPERPAGTQARLVALLDGRVVGTVYQDTHSNLRFVYEESWRADEASYPLSLSMPLTAREHRHPAIHAYLWGLLPDNERTLEHYGRTFSVSPRNPVSLLQHIGADCAGAVQFVPPDRLSELEGPNKKVQVDWIDEAEVARELRSAKETGLAGHDRRTIGRFSLAGAQPKIALFHKNGKWGRPLGRTPTTHILKPPSNQFTGFAENEHLCLDLAEELGLSAASSTIRVLDDEVAVVVERFDRRPNEHRYRRLHQEDMCQALSVLPWGKYQNEGGPGIASIVGLIQEASLNPEVDLARFIDVVGLNWVLAATDAHAKNYAFIHVPGGGVRLAPFYDIVSYLPYTDRRLHDIKMAMTIGSDYFIRKIARRHWVALASEARLTPDYVLGRLEALLPRIPDAASVVARRAVAQGLNSQIVESLAERIVERSHDCLDRLRVGSEERHGKA